MPEKTKQIFIQNWLNAFKQDSNNAVRKANQQLTGFTANFQKYLSRYDRPFAFEKAVKAAF